MAEKVDKLELARLREEVAKLRRQVYWGGSILTGLLICSLLLPTWVFLIVVVVVLLLLYPRLRKLVGKWLEQGAKKLTGG